MLLFQIMSRKKKVSLGYLEGLNWLMGLLYLHCCWLLQLDAGVFCCRNSHLASHRGAVTLPQHCHSRKMLSKKPCDCWTNSMHMNSISIGDVVYEKKSHPLTSLLGRTPILQMTSKHANEKGLVQHTVANLDGY